MYLLIGMIVGSMSLLEIYCKRWFPLLKGYMFFLLIVFLFIVVAYRQCGYDYDNYMSIYRVLHSSAWTENTNFLGIEPGYGFLNYICTSFRQLLIVMAFLSLSLYAAFVYKYSPLPFLSFFLLLSIVLYGGMMGQYRQSLAIGIVSMAVSLRKSRMSFLCLLAIAYLFHRTAAIAIILLFVPEKIYSLKFYLYLLLLSLVFHFVGEELLAVMSIVFPEKIQSKLYTYAVTEAGKVFGFNLAMLLRILIFGYLWRYRLLIGQYSYGYFFLNSYFVSLIFYLSFGFLPQLAGRGSLYFSVFEFILPAMVIAKNKKAYCGILFFLFVSIYRQFSLFTGNGSDDYLPYHSAFFQLIGL